MTVTGKNIRENLKYWLIIGIKRLVLGNSSLNRVETERKFEQAKAIIRAIVRNVLIDRKGTYCPKLWNEAYIDMNGNVYNCCYSRPTVIGNLHQNELSNIWRKSPRLKLARWLSRHKALYCSLNCDLISQAEKNKPRKQAKSSYPNTIRITHGELCNIACTMCWQNHTNRHVISNDLLKERVDWDSVKEIELQGGEVLAMKQAKEFYLWVTKEKQKKASLITNGLLINDEWAQNLVQGAEWIMVSVNAASEKVHEMVNVRSKHSRVIDNIQRLVRLKQETGSSVKIIYKYTIIKDNIHEIADAIPVAAELGCDKIAYGYDVDVPEYIRQNPELRDHLRQQLRSQIAMNHPIEIDRLRLKYLDLLEETDFA